MKLGIIFPQTEIGNDPILIRDYAQCAEQLGFDHIAIYDHVLGAGLANRPDWRGVYSYKDAFHEPFVLFGYLAAFTARIGLALDVLVLPQRQTALAAKQAATVDVLSNGRLRLGVGVGWNDVEFTALGMDFHNRGKRVDEQIEVLRALWTNELVTFEGKWHTIPDAGIKPMPVQRPIPIWIGGNSEAALSRVARLGDGWLPQVRPDDSARAVLDHLRELLAQEGRRLEDIGIGPRANYKPGGEDRLVENAVLWRDMGATDLLVHTMGAGLTPADHLSILSQLRELFQKELGV